MKWRRLAGLLTAMAILATPWRVGAAEGDMTAVYRVDRVVLLQPEFVLKERLPDPAGLGRFITAVNEAVAAVAARRTNAVPTSGFLVVAIRPEGRSRVWVDMEPEPDAALANSLRQAAEAVPVPAVREGTVVLAIQTGLWGGAPGDRAAMPSPAEWRDYVKNHPGRYEMAQLADVVWGTAGVTPLLKPPAPALPDGYELASLYPMKIQVPKPVDWLQDGHPTTTGWEWSFARRGGVTDSGYDAGMRLQLASELKARGGPWPRERARQIVEARKKVAASVLRQCPFDVDGDRVQTCLEVLERNGKGKNARQFHVLYTLTWSDAGDYLLLSTFGAPAAEWEQYAPIARKMSEFRQPAPESP